MAPTSSGGAGPLSLRRRGGKPAHSPLWGTGETPFFPPPYLHPAWAQLCGRVAGSTSAGLGPERPSHPDPPHPEAPVASKGGPQTQPVSRFAGVLPFPWVGAPVSMKALLRVSSRRVPVWGAQQATLQAEVSPPFLWPARLGDLTLSPPGLSPRSHSPPEPLPRAGPPDAEAGGGEGTGSDTEMLLFERENTEAPASSWNRHRPCRGVCVPHPAPDTHVEQLSGRPPRWASFSPVTRRVATDPSDKPLGHGQRGGGTVPTCRALASPRRQALRPHSAPDRPRRSPEGRGGSRCCWALSGLHWPPEP